MGGGTSRDDGGDINGCHRVFHPIRGKNPCCSAVWDRGGFNNSCLSARGIGFQPILQILVLWGSSRAGDVTDDRPARPCWEPAGLAACRSENPAPLGPIQPFRGGWTKLRTPRLPSPRQLSCALGSMSQFDNVLMHFTLKYSSGTEKHSLPLGLPLWKTDQFQSFHRPSEHHLRSLGSRDFRRWSAQGKGRGDGKAPRPP